MSRDIGQHDGPDSDHGVIPEGESVAADGVRREMHSRAYARATEDRGIRSDERELADANVVAHVCSGSQKCVPAEPRAVLNDDVRSDVATEVEARRAGDQRTWIDDARPTLVGDAQPLQASVTLRGVPRGWEGSNKQQVGRESLPVLERAENAMLADVRAQLDEIIEEAGQSNRLTALC